MGLIAELEKRNAELERRVAHLEKAFEGLREYAASKLPPICYHHNYRSTGGQGLVCTDCGYTWQNKRR